VICSGSDRACEASEPRAVILNEVKDLAAAFEGQRLQSRWQGGAVILNEVKDLAAAFEGQPLRSRWQPRAVILNEVKDLAAAFKCQRPQSRWQGGAVIPARLPKPQKTVCCWIASCCWYRR
jgi:hypothetical protein